MTTPDTQYDLRIVGKGASAFSPALYQIKPVMFGAMFEAGGERN